MGKTALRSAVKVELDKDAGTLPYLHVSSLYDCNFSPADFMRRIDGIPTFRLAAQSRMVKPSRLNA